MKPEQRAKWLSKVLQRGQEGKAPLNTVYDIIAHQKFASDLADGVGRRMYRILSGHLGSFSQRQQRFLEGECKLAQLFKSPSPAASSSTPSTADVTEDMMARCRSFIRQKQQEGLETDGSDSTGLHRAQAGTVVKGSSEGLDDELDVALAGRGAGVVGRESTFSNSSSTQAGWSDRDSSDNWADMSALWDWLNGQSPGRREEYVSSLDPIMKECFETFLMMRIRARNDASSNSAGCASYRAGVGRSRSRSRRSADSVSTSSSSSSCAASRGANRSSRQTRARSHSRAGRMGTR